MVQAVLGDTLTVNTPYGDESYELKPGTQPGTVVTLKNKGMANVHNPNRVGDLEVTVNVGIPSKITARQEELLREFASISGESLNQGSIKDLKKRFGKKK
jgi:molecular chaperone DnaJ